MFHKWTLDFICRQNDIRGSQILTFEIPRCQFKPKRMAVSTSQIQAKTGKSNHERSTHQSLFNGTEWDPCHFGLQVTPSSESGLLSKSIFPRTWRVIVYGKYFFWYRRCCICITCEMNSHVYISYQNRRQSFQVSMENLVACEEWTLAPHVVCSLVCLPSVFRELKWQVLMGMGCVCVHEICFYSRQLIHITTQKIIRILPICSSQPQKSKGRKAGKLHLYSIEAYAYLAQTEVVQIFFLGLKT